MDRCVSRPHGPSRRPGYWHRPDDASTDSYGRRSARARVRIGVRAFDHAQQQVRVSPRPRIRHLVRPYESWHDWIAEMRPACCHTAVANAARPPSPVKPPSDPDCQPGSFTSQLMQRSSVQRFPMPHFGQSFSPSVEVANGDSRGGSRARRCLRRIASVATMPSVAASVMARSCCVWSMSKPRWPVPLPSKPRLTRCGQPTLRFCRQTRGLNVWQDSRRLRRPDRSAGYPGPYRPHR